MKDKEGGGVLKVNYENELYDVLIEALCDKYGIKDEFKCFQYFCLRFLVSNLGKTIDMFLWYKNMAIFMIREIDLPMEEKELIWYKDTEVGINPGISQSIGNILVSWENRANMTPIVDVNSKQYDLKSYITETWKKIKQYGKNKSNKYKGLNSYWDYMKYYSLEKLNDFYGTKAGGSVQLRDFRYKYAFNTLKRTMEEELEAIIHGYRLKTYNTNEIKEEDIEVYVIGHLSLIEDGLTYVDRQVAIQNGRIDILARDRNNNYVIIELKIVEDKELIWQAIYYPKRFQQERKCIGVRMLTLCPSYSKHIIEALELVPDVEIFRYIPTVSNGKIEGLNIRRINYRK